MATATFNTSLNTRTQPNYLWLPLLVAWHLLVGGVLVFGAIIAATQNRLFGLDLSGADVLARTLIAIVVLAMGAFSLFTAYAVVTRKRIGRALSLIIDYVGFIAFLVTTLQALNVFNGVTALADAIERSWPYALGYIILLVAYAQIGRLPDRLHAPLRRVGSIALAILGVLLLLQFGVLNSLIDAVSHIGPALPFFVLTLAFGAMGWLMFRHPAAVAFRETLATREAVMGLLFLSPNLLGFVVFFAGPLIVALFLSFTQYELFTPPKWIGTQNYTEILGVNIAASDNPTAEASTLVPAIYQEVGRVTLINRTYIFTATDPVFWIALRNTIMWVILIVPLSILPALGLAVLLNSKVRGVGFFRPLFFLPVVAGVVGVSLIWVWLYNADIGSFNSLIGSIVETVNRLSGRQLLTNPKINWLTHQDSALFSIAFMAAWMNLGYNMIIFLAGLQNIPRPLYEAARVDGATGTKAFRFITLPMLAPTTFFVVTTTLINAFQVFTEPYVMGFNNGRGPGNSTVTGVVYLYNIGFASSNHMGYASAIAWVLVVIIFIITFIQFRASERYTNVT